jgi:transposase, IS5 family
MRSGRFFDFSATFCWLRRTNRVYRLVVIGSTVRPASLFSFAFFKEAVAIADPILDPIDLLLDDPELVALCARLLEGRSTRSATFGRTGIAPDRLLRCVVLKHFKDWSFRQLERELRCNLLYRRFTRFYEDPIPDFTSFSRIFGLFGSDGTAQIHQRIVEKAAQAAVAQGKKLRTDTTAVESNIHHPTDSSLLADSLRVLTRSLKRISAGCKGVEIKVVDHARCAKYRVLEICRAAKKFNDAGRQQIKDSYQKLMQTTRQVAAQAVMVLAHLRSGELAPRSESFLQVLQAESSLRHYLPLVENVIAQTQARIVEGDTRHPDKILSLFEPHSVVIRKGKAHKPNEFGRLVRIDEVENGIVSHYAVAGGNPCDQTQWKPALENHVEIFGQAPRMACADRGFWNAANEKFAEQLGVKHVVLPGRGRLSETRARRQKKRWFRCGQGWRAGIEARVSTLKHRFGMRRAFYKGEVGFERHVGWAVIAHNLVAMTRALRPQNQKEKPLTG